MRLTSNVFERDRRTYLYVAGARISYVTKPYGWYRVIIIYYDGSLGFIPLKYFTSGKKHKRYY